MRNLRHTINEALGYDETYMLNKWFERDRTSREEFVALVKFYIETPVVASELSDKIHGSHIERSLPQFISFVTQEVCLPENTDCVYQLQKIIELVLADKSENRFVI